MFFFVGSVLAQSVSDDEWMKQRLTRIHEKYATHDEHEKIRDKLQQAEKNTTSKPVRDALAQIIIRWEELNESASPTSFSSVLSWSIASDQEQGNWLQEIAEDIISSDDRYELQNWYIDVAVLQTTRLWRVNELRSSRGRHHLTLEPLLHKTAADRSETMQHKWVADHKRFKGSAYYAYGEIQQWFSDRGVEFVNVSRATFTENIGRATFRCKQENCTQTAIDAMRETFEFYLREEGTKNDAHWRTMMHPLFNIVGLWISVNEWAGKFYLTTHYGTQIK